MASYTTPISAATQQDLQLQCVNTVEVVDTIQRQANVNNVPTLDQEIKRVEVQISKVESEIKAAAIQAQNVDSDPGTLQYWRQKEADLRQKKLLILSERPGTHSQGNFGKRMNAFIEVAASAKRPNIDEQFIIDEKLNFGNEEGLAKYLIHLLLRKIRKNNRDMHSAKFQDNCLELRLDERMTKYLLDNVNNVKVLLAPSGAGKTRMLLELLYNTFGYYFTVSNPEIDFGSSDLNVCSEWCDTNPNLTEFYLSVLYFVRVTICNFLKKELGYTESQILLAQLHPRACFGSDIFRFLFETVLSVRKSTVVLDIGEHFPFIVIDEIQTSLNGFVNHRLPSSRNMRPFFAPLVYYSKSCFNFPQFLIAGTGLDFDILQEVLGAGGSTFKRNVVLQHQVIANEFEPLSKDQVTNYARFVLEQHQLPEVEEIVSRISEFKFCHGRARFVAYILDGYLESKDIKRVITEFAEQLRSVTSHIFPLAFLKRDLANNGKPLHRLVGNETLYTIIRNALLDFILAGNATMKLTSQSAADAIRYGVGFGVTNSNVLDIVKFSELAILESLRYLIPFGDLIARFAELISSCPKPQLVCYLVEYLVAFALVANTSSVEDAKNIEVSQGDVSSYLSSENSNVVCFPDNMCGADLIYKCLKSKTVYIFQIKFVKVITKQQQVNACNTTDTEKFYCNRKTGHVLKGFEDKKRKAAETIRYLQCNGFSIQQVVFVHTAGKELSEMRGVEVVSSTSNPEFFHSISPGLWDFLDNARQEYENGSNNTTV